MSHLVEQQLKRHMNALMHLCEETRKTKVEYGLVICHDKDLSSNKTHIEGRCKGKKCEVEFKGCKNKLQFASAHSHPVGATNMPSTQDVILSIHQGERAFCICAPMRGKDFTRCYELTTDQQTLDKYTDAFLQHNDNQMMDMIVRSIFQPNDTTLFRPIIDKIRKRGKK